MNPQMQQYRHGAYQQPQQRGAPAARRPGNIAPNAVPYGHPNAAAAAQHAQQIQSANAQQRHALLEHQSAQRRAKKPTDKNLPDGIDEILVNPELATQYRELREAERKLDYLMIRKRSELSDRATQHNRVQRILRVWIRNTAENQPWQGGNLDENTFDFSSGNDPTYRISVEGRLLDDPNEETSDESDHEDDQDTDSKEKGDKKPLFKFTHYIKSLSIDFDRARQGAVGDANMQVDWKKPANWSDVDMLNFSRRGDENMNVTVNIVRDETQDRFRLSHALSQTLDMEEADRQEVVMWLWEYIKTMGLQEDDEKRSIRCDDNLRQIFGRDQVLFPQIPELITPHLHPLAPVKLPYTIRVDPEYVKNPKDTVYDIRVHVEDPLRGKIVSALQTQEYLNILRQLQRLDDELAVVVQAIHNSKSKHTFYKQVARDPAGLVKKWMASQRRDLEVILGEAARGGGEDGMGVEFSRGGQDSVWNSDLTREAVRYMLAKPQVLKQ